MKFRGHRLNKSRCKTWVSVFYNENKNTDKRKIKVFDTTLRDGEQTPGISLTVDQKIKIAEQLDELGVNYIEAGFPSSSEAEKSAVEKIAKLDLDASVCGLARTKKNDIDACIDSNVDLIHTFISTSDIQLKHTIKKDKEEVKEIVSEKIEYIKEHDVSCLFSAMDATRTEKSFLKNLFSLAEEAGADIINIPDTVGVMTPERMKKLVSDIRKDLDITIDVHCHNDFGLAVANTISAIEAGADQVQVTINGIGERAGNACLQETVMSLESLLNLETNIKTEKLYEISKLVERLTGIKLLPNSPIVGENAFSHESGIHAHGVISNSETFEPGIMTPEMVGHKRRLVAGKHMGKHSVKEMLKDSGLDPSEEELKEITKRIKELANKGKKITEVDLYTIAEVVMGSAKEKTIDLKELAVMTGNNMIPTASVRANIKGKEKKASETGVGPVDAAINATQSLMNNFPNISLTSFRIEAITGGSDAIAEITVEVQDEQGKAIKARSESEDIVEASVKALISAINRLIQDK
ncbi:MAG: Isopropylmalate/homocitrate/citramalate synthase LeuA family [Candidatus Methanohalarchaeum thermophilum]|uniref:2-isopropylmalate synthase n=1 Tax=Methanohalarchaeum thermophilum TaxID=1903181 RepID=A0A1Q6DV10_METT1|nr:MAG: Isopropylmalate/homocitrate/citramalate synthase LeuA family [Candidatus Methanohalarchaeum thermophilum]